LAGIADISRSRTGHTIRFRQETLRKVFQILPQTQITQILYLSVKLDIVRDSLTITTSDPHKAIIIKLHHNFLITFNKNQQMCTEIVKPWTLNV